MFGFSFKRVLLVQLSLWLMAWAFATQAVAQTNLDVSGDSVLQEVHWSVEPDGQVLVSAQMVLLLPQAMVDALKQGIPVYFVAHAWLTRPKWWLWETTEVEAHRFWRLSYQPLTRVWRLQFSQESSKHTDSSQGLAQYFDSLEQALAVMQRISNWPVGDSAKLQKNTEYEAEFSLGIDKVRLPRPLQFDVQGRNDWDLQLRSGSFRLSVGAH
ncbi:DUF4390 domain-containing protein [Lampropedia puyangensis]|uniref:DUF4390 domain-containing protein n=1 Tax=Lampropedia puyangensis TaxID=1330072 RepID=A0A4S8EZM4_9BURK|nr:DUF4390 domain-containing protein [Lampropedia puyangensis]THT98271.1 DUF4390 domain-containing protein [Lampropedia puyangensis]